MRVWILSIALLLAGCATPTDDGVDPGETGGSTGGQQGGGNGFAPQTGQDEATDPKAPGLVVRGNMWACDKGYCVNVTASNVGSRTYHVSNFCVPPWSDAMFHDDAEVAHRQPYGYCMGFGTGPFAPGAEAFFDASWNGTLWNDAKQTYQPAAQGGYDWNVTFRAYDAADGDGSHELMVTFHVLIGIPT